MNAVSITLLVVLLVVVGVTIYLAVTLARGPGPRRVFKPTPPMWPVVEVISERAPALYLAKGFLSPEEADHLIDLATPRFERSSVVDRTTGANVPDADRTSSTVFLKRAEDDVVARVEKRAADLTGIPVQYFERLQVVRYEPGQFYKPHHDYLDANLPDVKKNGQRVATVFVYLNNLKEGEEGGGTRFPSINKTITPQQGVAAMWWSHTPEGKLDDKTLHSGEPVTKSIKYGLNIWARDRPQA